MATQRQTRKGTTAQHSTFTGALAEVTVNTDNNTLVVHDGATAGGFELSNFVHPTGDGNLHVPANSTTNNGKVLTASATAGVYTWETPTGGFSSPLTTKGDVLVYSTTNDRLAIGTNGQVLTADSTAATGMKWAAAAGGGTVDTVVGGNKITVDATDAANPIANLDALAKTDVGLANVDNTADSAKPVSTAQQTALDGKVDDAQVLTNVPSGALFTDTDTVYSHPTGDGNLHVPANSTTNDGKVLTAGATAGLYTWETPTGGTGIAQPTTNNTDDMGDTTNAFKDLYIHRIMTPRATDGLIGIDSVDGTDDRKLHITAGSTDNISNRGSSVDLYGNQHATKPGVMVLAGGAAGAIEIWTSNTFRGSWLAGGDLSLEGQVTLKGGVPGVGKVLTSDASGNASWETAAGGTATDLLVAAFVQGVITDFERLATHIVSQAFSLPVGLTGTVAYTETVSTAAATIDIRKNNVSVGTINFALGASTATFTFTTLTSFAVGDRLSFVGQATADATLGDVSITMKGTIV